ncbi:MAG: hypothetical protein ABIK92_16410 [Pseudomonadota bacterium]
MAVVSGFSSAYSRVNCVIRKMIDIESVIQKKAKKLRAIADGLVGLYPIETKTVKFNTKILDHESNPPELVNEFYTWEKVQKSIFVYYFSVLQDADLEIIQKRITDAKKEKLAQRAYPRINSPSRYLYVGSSREIAKRIKEHLGFGYEKTYAMNLAFWCNDLNLDMDIFCMRYNPTATKEVIQAFEDGLWDHLKPLLGRQGAR